MNMPGKFAAAAVAIFFSLLLGSRGASAQSPYDLIGFGTPTNGHSAHAFGLSGTGVATRDKNWVNDFNPASWSYLDRARFEIHVREDLVRSELGTTRSQSGNFRFSGFSFGARFWTKYDASLAVGFSPLTDAAAKVVTASASQTSTYRSQGGVTKGFVGAAFRPSDGIAIGATFDVLFGNIRHLTDIRYVSGDFVSGEFERDYALNGFRSTLGVLLSGDSLGEGLRGWNLGLSYATPSGLVSKRRTVVTPISASLDTTLEDKGKGFYPGVLQAGLSYELSKRSVVETDVTLANFSQAYLYGATGAADPAMQDAQRFAISIERRANIAGEFGIDGFWSRLGLRGGFAYSMLPFAPIGSGGVNEVSVSLGLGIPFSYASLLDFSISGGMRSPVNAASAPKDMFVKVAVSVGLSERWFRQTRLTDN